MTDHQKRKEILLYRIIVPVLVIALAAALWIVSGAGHNAADKPDFALDADDSFDLEQLKSYGLPSSLNLATTSARRAGR
jgi:hypothetical protein